MFEAQFDEGYGNGLPGPDSVNAPFKWGMVDKLQPELEAGEYSLSWRWDCEHTAQVWNSCADVTIPPPTQ